MRLLPGPFKANLDREGQWLLSLPVDRLLYSFRVNAGLLPGQPDGVTKTPKPLGGWEALTIDLRGHSTGHVLSGLAFQYASTGNPVFRVKSDSLVAGLAEVQQALKQGGYLSAFPIVPASSRTASIIPPGPWWARRNSSRSMAPTRPARLCFLLAFAQLFVPVRVLMIWLRHPAILRSLVLLVAAGGFFETFVTLRLAIPSTSSWTTLWTAALVPGLLNELINVDVQYRFWPGLLSLVALAVMVYQLTRPVELRSRQPL
ncbi:MAG: beta-L-arabinofuranosidase domain-containing protein [Hymenobacter sp.]